MALSDCWATGQDASGSCYPPAGQRGWRVLTAVSQPSFPSSTFFKPSTSYASFVMHNPLLFSFTGYVLALIFSSGSFYSFIGFASISLWAFFGNTTHLFINVTPSTTKASDTCFSSRPWMFVFWFCLRVKLSSALCSCTRACACVWVSVCLRVWVCVRMCCFCAFVCYCCLLCFLTPSCLCCGNVFVFNRIFPLFQFPLSKINAATFIIYWFAYESSWFFVAQSAPVF